MCWQAPSLACSVTCVGLGILGLKTQAGAHERKTGHFPYPKVGGLQASPIHVQTRVSLKCVCVCARAGVLVYVRLYVLCVRALSVHWARRAQNIKDMSVGAMHRKSTPGKSAHCHRKNERCRHIERRRHEFRRRASDTCADFANGGRLILVGPLAASALLGEARRTLAPISAQSVGRFVLAAFPAAGMNFGEARRTQTQISARSIGRLAFDRPSVAARTSPGKKCLSGTFSDGPTERYGLSFSHVLAWGVPLHGPVAT